MNGGGSEQIPLDAEQSERKQKVSKIFQHVDANGDGRLNREEMVALLKAVNPRVKFSEEQISSILEDLLRTYGEYIEGDKGLSFEGLLKSYDDGAGDVDRDFDTLDLDLGGRGGRAKEKPSASRWSRARDTHRSGVSVNHE